MVSPLANPGLTPQRLFFIKTAERLSAPPVIGDHLQSGTIRTLCFSSSNAPLRSLSMIWLENITYTDSEMGWKYGQAVVRTYGGFILGTSVRERIVGCAHYNLLPTPRKKLGGVWQVNMEQLSSRSLTSTTPAHTDWHRSAFLACSFIVEPFNLLHLLQRLHWY